MRSNHLIRRVLPPLAAFIVAASGAVMVFNSSSRAVVGAPELIPTLVATTELKIGTPVSSLAGLVEVRQLPPDARASGAVASLAELPSDAVVTIPVVVGQQVLTSVLGADPRSSVGAGLIAVSAKLDPQQWTGPVATSGNHVDVYAISSPTALLIARGVIVLDAPDPSTLSPQQDAVITLGVAPTDVAAVIGAIAGDGIWLATA